jgi:hypothetical protein
MFWHDSIENWRIQKKTYIFFHLYKCFVYFVMFCVWWPNKLKNTPHELNEKHDRLWIGVKKSNNSSKKKEETKKKIILQFHLAIFNFSSWCCCWVVAHERLTTFNTEQFCFREEKSSKKQQEYKESSSFNRKRVLITFRCKFIIEERCLYIFYLYKEWKS